MTPGNTVPAAELDAPALSAPAAPALSAPTRQSSFIPKTAFATAAVLAALLAPKAADAQQPPQIAADTLSQGTEVYVEGCDKYDPSDQSHTCTVDKPISIFWFGKDSECPDQAKEKEAFSLTTLDGVPVNVGDNETVCILGAPGPHQHVPGNKQGIIFKEAGIYNFVVVRGGEKKVLRFLVNADPLAVGNQANATANASKSAADKAAADAAAAKLAADEANGDTALKRRRSFMVTANVFPDLYDRTGEPSGDFRAQYQQVLTGVREDLHAIWGVEAGAGFGSVQIELPNGIQGNADPNTMNDISAGLGIGAGIPFTVGSNTAFGLDMMLKAGGEVVWSPEREATENITAKSFASFSPYGALTAGFFADLAGIKVYGGGRLEIKSSPVAQAVILTNDPNDPEIGYRRDFMFFVGPEFGVGGYWK